MAVLRRQWKDLPEGVRVAIEARTGPVLHAESAGEGKNSAIAAVLRSTRGTTFLKGLPLDHHQAWTQDHEAAIAPYLTTVAPRMLWRLQAGGWDFIGWEHAPGRPAGFAPGSADIGVTAEALAVLAKVPCPDVAVKTVDRWRDYVDHPGELALFDGPALAHTDLNPGNVLITDHGRALLVDWAWPTRAAAWIDAACWTIWLITDGHSPAAAEGHAARIPAWQHADTAGLTSFANVQTRVWAQIAADAPWARKVADAAAHWRDHRMGRGDA